MLFETCCFLVKVDGLRLQSCVAFFQLNLGDLGVPSFLPVFIAFLALTCIDGFGVLMLQV